MVKQRASVQPPCRRFVLHRCGHSLSVRKSSFWTGLTGRAGAGRLGQQLQMLRHRWGSRPKRRLTAIVGPAHSSFTAIQKSAFCRVTASVARECRTSPGNFASSSALRAYRRSPWRRRLRTAAALARTWTAHSSTDTPRRRLRLAASACRICFAVVSRNIVPSFSS